MGSPPTPGFAKKRSVSRDLTMALILTVTLVTSLAVSIFYINSLRHSKAQLESKADEYIHSLERVTELPLWNFDGESLKRIANAYARNQLVDELIISDANGKELCRVSKGSKASTVERAVDVYTGNTLVGHISLALTSQLYLSENRRLFWVSLGTILVVIAVLSVATHFYLRLFLRKPLLRMEEIADSFVSGTDQLLPEQVPCSEFKPLVGALGEMGKKIRLQMGMLRESRDELEIRVSERTGELANSNEKLRAEVLHRTRMEEDLRKSHSEVEHLLASLSSFLIGIGMDLSIRRWNSTAELTFGKRAVDVIGKKLSEIQIGWDWAALVATVPGWPVLEQSFHSSNIAYQRVDNETGFLSLTISPIRNTAGQTEGYLILGMDITERRTLELQLDLARKLESVGQLAAGIAHEINTPIQYIGDNLRFIQGAFGDLKKLISEYEKLAEAAKSNAFTPADLEKVEEARRQVDFDYLSIEIPAATEQSIDGVKRVASIVQAMKEFSHPGSKEKIPVDINRAIQTTLTVARNEWKYVAEVETQLDPNLPMVPCLADELNQVILNLVVNAAQAIGEVVKSNPNTKGLIRIQTKMMNDDWVEIRISDTGCGIPEQIRHKIFMPFFTTKGVGKGTGQGLAISRATIVKKHGGQLFFETKVGEGTTFVIRLPVSTAMAAK